MNTPNPLVPQGALERQSKGKSTVRIAIFTIVSIHAVFFAGLLMQGCRRDEGKTPIHSAEAATNQNTAALETGYYQSTQDPAQVLSPAPIQSAPPPAVSEPVPNLPTPTSPEASASDTKAYTVAKGDNLTRIATAKGTTVAAITKANPNLDPARLKPGQIIQLPAAASAAPRGIGYAEPAKSETVIASGNTHRVKAGETLTRVAKQHGTTVKALRAANNLKTDRLLVGQRLKVPVAQGSRPSGELRTSTVSKLSATSATRADSLATNVR